MDFKLLYLFYLDFKNGFKECFQTSMHFIKLIHSVKSDPPQPIFFSRPHCQLLVLRHCAEFILPGCIAYVRVVMHNSRTAVVDCKSEFYLYCNCNALSAFFCNN